MGGRVASELEAAINCPNSPLFSASEFPEKTGQWSWLACDDTYVEEQVHELRIH